MEKRKFTILVVDDEKIIHESCGRILRDEGYTVETALSGQEALLKLKEKQYDLVLSDIKMPGMSGVEALEKMKKEVPDITVVMFTGYSSVETARDSMKLGAADYLPKPFTPEELLRVVREALQKKLRSEENREREGRFQEITSAIHSTLNLREVLNLIATGVVKVMKLKGCAISLLDKKKEYFKICAAYGLSDNYLKKGPIAADKTLSKVLSGKPESVLDITTSPHAQYLWEAKEEGIASIFSLPLKVGGEVIGMIRIYTADPKEFFQDEMELLSSFAQQASIALENARTYEDVREKYESLKDDLWEWCEYDSMKIR
jgi:YesN/AraC family two-component response regulator